MRCEEHGLAAGPSGECVVCLREARALAQQRARRLSAGFFAAVLAVCVCCWRRERFVLPCLLRVLKELSRLLRSPLSSSQWLARQARRARPLLPRANRRTEALRARLRLRKRRLRRLRQSRRPSLTCRPTKKCRRRITPRRCSCFPRPGARTATAHASFFRRTGCKSWIVTSMLTPARTQSSSAALADRPSH